MESSHFEALVTRLPVSLLIAWVLRPSRFISISCCMSVPLAMAALLHRGSAGLPPSEGEEFSNGYMGIFTPAVTLSFTRSEHPPGISSVWREFLLRSFEPISAVAKVPHAPPGW